MSEEQNKHFGVHHCGGKLLFEGILDYGVISCTSCGKEWGLQLIVREELMMELEELNEEEEKE